MTLVLDDDGLNWSSLINSNFFLSYWIVAFSAVAIYDWALTFGQEVELVWKQRWSLMTILYLIVRYIEIPYIVINLLQNIPSISLTNTVSKIFFLTQFLMIVVTNSAVSVITITRLHAMYQRSNKMLSFLVVIFMAITIASVVIAITAVKHISEGETILFGTYQCIIVLDDDVALLIAMVWTLTAAWEILALCLAVWIAAKHFRELRQMPRGRGIIGDSFTVLIQTHLIYFASFFTVSCLSFMASLMETETYYGLRQIFLIVQMFVLGPRLIFNVRNFHAKLVASSDEGTSMASIDFQERIRVSTGGNV